MLAMPATRDNEAASSSEAAKSQQPPQQQEGGHRKRKETDQGEESKKAKETKGEQENEETSEIRAAAEQEAKLNEMKFLMNWITQSRRDHEGATWSGTGQKTTRTCGDGVRAQGAIHTLGPPLIRAWVGLLQALIRRDPTGAMFDTVTLQTLTEHNSWLASATTEENPEMRRITFSLHDQALRTAVAALMEGDHLECGEPNPREEVARSREDRQEEE